MKVSIKESRRIGETLCEAWFSKPYPKTEKDVDDILKEYDEIDDCTEQDILAVKLYLNIISEEEWKSKQ